MDSLPPGNGTDLAHALRRIEMLERFLQPYTRTQIVGEVPGRDRVRLDVLGREWGPVDDITRPQYHIHGIKRTKGSTTTHDVFIQKGYVLGRNPALLASSVLPQFTPLINGTGDMETVPMAVTASHVIYCRVTTDALDLVTGASIVALSIPPPNVHAQPAQLELDGLVDQQETPGIYYYPIAAFSETAGKFKLAHQYQSGGPIKHDPGRNGFNGTQVLKDCNNYRVVFRDFKQGQFTSIHGADQIFIAGCSSSSTPPPP